MLSVLARPCSLTKISGDRRTPTEEAHKPLPMEENWHRTYTRHLRSALSLPGDTPSLSRSIKFARCSSTWRRPRLVAYRDGLSGETVGLNAIHQVETPRGLRPQSCAPCPPCTAPRPCPCTAPGWTAGSSLEQPHRTWAEARQRQTGRTVVKGSPLEMERASREETRGVPSVLKHDPPTGFSRRG